ncbi:membrane-bound O-acyltransferase family protein [Sphingobacteriaceae bacterium]|nr:membrane-bound O-acyltransferase family protein [Sphingobacteriaceae bacterium]
MLFNSLPFLLFFTLFFFIYWLAFARSLKIQNLFLLAGSYFFYAWWDWRFLMLLIASSFLNYILGIYIHKSENQKTRNLLVFIGLAQGLGGLLIFKYLNFFIDSFVNLLHYFNVEPNIHTLNLLMPLGISFYTFRTISYLLDVEKGKTEPVRNWCVFFNYVSFFPSVISGPIDRATLLVPQLSNKRQFDYNLATDGMRQILWGLFKKIVIADNCATITNSVFENYDTLPASSLLIGAFFYTLQIYADFSGYSDTAIGIAKLLGFTITRNFEYPFFAQNIAEFWRKWHISLTSWLTEYVFTPLSIAFRNYDQKGLIAAILVNFTLIGIWHGANWTFVLFGFLQGCYFIPLILKGTINKRKKIAKDQVLPTWKEFSNMLKTFTLVMFTFILFRSDTITDAFYYFKDLFSTSLFSQPQLSDKVNTVALLIFIFLMICIEWVQRDKQHALQFALPIEPQGSWFAKKTLRWAIYILIIFSILCFEGKEQDFIYFRF